MTVLLDVEHVSKFFPVGSGPNQLARLKRRLSGGPEKLPKVYAVDNVSLVIKKGETVGLVGESGCGKSTLVRALTRLIDVSGGSIKLGGRELALKPARVFARDRDRARIQMVFQDAGDSINPRFTAFDAIADPLRRLRHISGKALKERVEVVAGQCGLPLALLSRFPHQLSGGQRAHVGIARAIAAEPDLSRSKPPRRISSRHPDNIDWLVEASAQALGIPLERGWTEGVAFNLRLILRHAKLIDEFPLADDIEPAPVFHA